MGARYYLKCRGQIFGPFSGSKLKELASQGKIRPDDFIAKDGTEKFVRARKVGGLFPSGNSTGKSSPPPIPITPTSESDVEDDSRHEPSGADPPVIHADTPSLDLAERSARHKPDLPREYTLDVDSPSAIIVTVLDSKSTNGGCCHNEPIRLLRDGDQLVLRAKFLPRVHAFFLNTVFLIGVLAVNAGILFGYELVFPDENPYDAPTAREEKLSDYFCVLPMAGFTLLALFVMYPMTRAAVSSARDVVLSPQTVAVITREWENAFKVELNSGEWYRLHADNDEFAWIARELEFRVNP